MLYNLYYTKHNSRRRRNMTLEDIKDYAAGGVKFDVHFIGVSDGLRYTLEELIGKEEEYVEDFENVETFDPMENSFGTNPYKTIIDDVATPGGTTAAGIEVMEGLNPLFEVVSSLDGSSKNLKEIIKSI